MTPDVAVAVSAYARIGQVTEVLDRATRHHHALRHRLAGLAALHDAHQRMLQSAVPEDHRPARARATGRGRVARRRGEALQAVVTAEHGLRSSLEDLAVRAQSGEFARLLAAMSAAIGQQLAVLDGAAA